MVQSCRPNSNVSCVGVFIVEGHITCTLFACQREALTTSVKGSEAAFQSPPGKRVSFWNTSSMNSVCPASASVNKLEHKVHISCWRVEKKHTLFPHVTVVEIWHPRRAALKVTPVPSCKKTIVQREKAKRFACSNTECLHVGRNLNAAHTQSLDKSSQDILTSICNLCFINKVKIKVKITIRQLTSLFLMKHTIFAVFLTYNETSVVDA